VPIARLLSRHTSSKAAPDAVPQNWSSRHAAAAARNQVATTPRLSGVQPQPSPLPARIAAPHRQESAALFEQPISTEAAMNASCERRGAVRPAPAFRGSIRLQVDAMPTSLVPTPRLGNTGLIECRRQRHGTPHGTAHRRPTDDSQNPCRRWTNQPQAGRNGERCRRAPLHSSSCSNPRWHLTALMRSSERP
jgi:hypothetical protein